MREELLASAKHATIGTVVVLVVVGILYLVAPGVAERFGPGAIIISIAHVIGLVAIKAGAVHLRNRRQQRASLDA